MARRPAANVAPEPDDLMQGVMDDAALNEASTLADALEAVRGLAGDDVKVLVFKTPHGIRGTWQYCTELAFPLDLTEIANSLKEEFGAGAYALRVMQGGKIRTTKQFAIAQSRSEAAKPQGGGLLGAGGDGILALIMNQSNNQMQMMQAQMQAQAAAAQQQTQMMVSMFTAIIPALTGNKDTPATMISALAPFLQKDDGGMKGAIETLTMAKGLFGGNNEAPAENLMEAALKMAPAALGAVTAAIESRGNQRALPSPANNAPAQFTPAPVSLPGSAPITDPILQAIGPDIVFMAVRGYKPEDAALNAANRLDDAGITADDVQLLVVRIAATPNWLETLANEGVDLRAYPEWAQAFLAALHTELTDDSRDGDDSERSGGGDENARPDGAVSAGG